ncbi:MAG TPA: amidase [Cyanobacteria bacterium UBA11372]|nr:amidase [Cyanobacteria bacterium UBA11372]
MNWLQPKQTVSLLLLGSLATVSTVTATRLVNPKPAVAAQFCQCVAYVANRYGINIPANAKDVGPVLARNGFRQVGPTVGAVVVMQPSFPGADKTYGHVGVVESLQPDGRISVRGANQLGNKFTEYDCNNVTVIGFGNSVNGRSDVSFWVRGNSNPNPPPSGFKPANFSGWVMSTTGVNFRNSPRLADRSNQTAAYRTTLSFDGWIYGETVTDLQLGTPDARWFRIAGTSFWVPSAYIYGNPPNSRPMP